MKEKPASVSDSVWAKFLAWEGCPETGDCADEFMPWFECWLDGWKAGVEAANPD